MIMKDFKVYYLLFLFMLRSVSYERFLKDFIYLLDNTWLCLCYLLVMLFEFGLYSFDNGNPGDQQHSYFHRLR